MKNYFVGLLLFSPGLILLWFANYTKFPVNLLLCVPAIVYSILMGRYLDKKLEAKNMTTQAKIGDD